MRHIARIVLLVVAASFVVIDTPSTALAQYPVVVAPVQPVVPAVVGYSAERRGLFGRRVVMRPLVAPVAAAPVVPTVVHTAAMPATTVVARPVLPPPPVVMAKPAVVAPISVGYSSYYVAPVPTVTVTSYMPPVWAY